MSEELELQETPPPAPKISARLESLRFYRRSFADYAAAFGLEGQHATRTLKRYVACGRAVSPVDLPPFDDPPSMARWWRRMNEAGVMKHRPPEWIVLLEQVGAPKSPPTPSTTASPIPSDLPPEFALPDIDGQTTSGERQLRDFAEGWLKEMESAKRAQSTVRFYKAWNEYKSLIKELRSWQKDRQRERLASGEVLEASKEMEALSSVFSTMAKTFTGSLLSLTKKLHPELDDTSLRRCVMPYRDKIFSGLKASRFAKAIPPELLDAYASDTVSALAA